MASPVYQLAMCIRDAGVGFPILNNVEIYSGDGQIVYLMIFDDNLGIFLHVSVLQCVF